MSSQPEERVARSADGTPIGFLKFGSGPSLVFVHGSVNTGEEWLQVATAMAEQFTCYVMDRRGRGRSGDAAAYSLDRECEDIIAVLEVAGPEAHLLGHSYGAICALETARRLPIGRLVVYEPPLPVDGPVPEKNHGRLPRCRREQQTRPSLDHLPRKTSSTSPTGELAALRYDATLEENGAAHPHVDARTGNGRPSGTQS